MHFANGLSCCVQVKGSLLQQAGGLRGAMVWMVAYEGYRGDAYTLYPSATEMSTLRQMCGEVNVAVT